MIAVSLLSSCTRQPGEVTPVPPRGRIELPPTPRVLPKDLANSFAELSKLLPAGRYAEAASRYPPLLQKLGAVWGKSSPDLTPHCYNFALALKLSGQGAEATDVCVRPLETWPNDLS